MKDLLKNILKTYAPKLFKLLKNRKVELLKREKIELWKNNGCPVPPPHAVKQNVISEYQSKYKYLTLIETGTYRGEMVIAQMDNFKNIISIELGQDLFLKAQDKFINNKNVTIIQGDSGKVLPTILKRINEPVIFWLDGHYSAGITAKGDKECPIFEELDAVFSSKRLNHILLIDDARCFVGEGDYPTLEQLTAYVKSKDKNYQVEVEHDIIRFVNI